jgi:hypothetical protein
MCNGMYFHLKKRSSALATGPLGYTRQFHPTVIEPPTEPDARFIRLTAAVPVKSSCRTRIAAAAYAMPHTTPSG